MLHSPAWAHFMEKLANFGLSEVAAELDGPYTTKTRHACSFSFQVAHHFCLPFFGLLEVSNTFVSTDIVECSSMYFREQRSLLQDFQLPCPLPPKVQLRRKDNRNNYVPSFSSSHQFVPWCYFSARLLYLPSSMPPRYPPPSSLGRGFSKAGAGIISLYYGGPSVWLEPEAFPCKLKLLAKVKGGLQHEYICGPLEKICGPCPHRQYFWTG